MIPPWLHFSQNMHFIYPPCCLVRDNFFSTFYLWESKCNTVRSILHYSVRYQLVIIACEMLFFPTPHRQTGWEHRQTGDLPLSCIICLCLFQHCHHVSLSSYIDRGYGFMDSMDCISYGIMGGIIHIIGYMDGKDSGYPILVHLFPICYWVMVIPWRVTLSWWWQVA